MRLTRLGLFSEMCGNMDYSKRKEFFIFIFHCYTILSRVSKWHCSWRKMLQLLMYVVFDTQSK